MTSVTNIILFPADAPELSDIFAAVECSGPDIPSDDYIRSAARRVGDVLARHFCLEISQIRLISFGPEYEPTSLISLGDFGHNDVGPTRLLDIDNFVCLLLCHERTDWDQTCLSVSQGFSMEFWAIGFTEQGIIIRQEYARGQRLEGYFSDNRFGVNEGMFVLLIRKLSILLQK